MYRPPITTEEEIPMSAMFSQTEENIARIANGYNSSYDDFHAMHIYDVRNFQKLIQQQFADLSENIFFDFVEYLPYKYDSIDKMIADFRKGTIKVNTSGNDSRLWGKVYNLQFRAIHDYIHCLHHLNFNFQDEVKAFEKQVRFSMQDRYTRKFPYMDWNLYYQTLRSEIIYQAAVKTHSKLFDLDSQKIVLKDL